MLDFFLVAGIFVPLRQENYLLQRELGARPIWKLSAENKTKTKISRKNVAPSVCVRGVSAVYPKPPKGRNNEINYKLRIIVYDFPPRSVSLRVQDDPAGEPVQG